MTLAHEMSRIGARAKEASRQMAKASPGAKALFLHRLAALLEQEQESLLAANARDLDAADARGIDAPRRDRLRLTPAVIAEMARACHHVADLDDPVGATESQWQRPNGLLVGRMRVPLGVVAMIYEARPNVTIDAAILCLKAGNAVILRGGSEALQSNMALAALLSQALDEAHLPADAAQLVTSTEHEAVTELCRLDQFIDVMIPRGGEALVRAVQEAATMPVLKHYKGVCHAFVEESADLDQALDIIFNAKVQRPGVCNALECLLVQASVAEDFLPRVAERLGAAGVRFHACPRALPLLGAAVQWVCSADLRLLSAPAAQGAKPRAGAGLTVSRLGGASGRAEREKEKEKGKGEEEKSEAEKEREERFFYEEKFPELIALMLQTKVVKMGQKQGFEFIEYFNQRGSRKTKAE